MQRFTRHCAALGLAALLVSLTPCYARDQSIPIEDMLKRSYVDLFKSSETELYVDVEHDGRRVTDLNASNFRVFVDGREQRFEIAVPETPASIVLLVEYSLKSRPYLQGIRSAVDSFVASIPQGNWYALATFNRNIDIVVDFTKEKRQIASALAGLRDPPWDDINTYDALSSLIDAMSRLPGRRVIVFVGSGLDTFSSQSFGDVLKKLETEGVIVYAISTASTLWNSPDATLENDLDRLQVRGFLTTMVEKSGGDVWFPSAEMMYRLAMQKIIEDLATQYKLVVHCAIPDDGRFHRIRVVAFSITDDKRKHFKVRVREGFRQR